MFQNSVSFVLFERFFFFADLLKKKDFHLVKSLYFCVGQRKKKELLEKNKYALTRFTKNLFKTAAHQQATKYDP